MIALDPFLHMRQKIQEAKIELDPYPHFFIEKLFPDDFYKMLLHYLPSNELMASLGTTGKVSKGSYLERSIFDFSPENFMKLPRFSFLFWKSFWNYLNSDDFINLQKEKFAPFFKERFQDQYEKINFQSYAEIIKDHKNYAIGPHTDSPERAVTMLFYFPKDESLKHLGTSIYVPEDKNFRCAGRCHHKFQGFTNVKTVPFVPNSLFGFVKSDTSFHGVEKIQDEDIERNLMNYVLKIVS